MSDFRGIPEHTEIVDGDELRNINSFDYLANLADLMPQELATQSPLFQKVKDRCGNQASYDSKYPYGDLYTDFILHLEKLISNDPSILNIPSIDAMLTAIYANPNHALERSAGMVQDVLKLTSHTDPKIQSAVRRRLLGKRTSLLDRLLEHVNYHIPFRNINRTTPQQEGSKLGRLKAMLSQTFKPQSTTSLPSVRTYQYQTETMPKEYRFGTQGQFHKGNPRVSPLFRAWLNIESKKPAKTSNGITHLYFNNLGWDRTSYEGKREKKLSQILHTLRATHPNIAVITLPADKGLMSTKLLKHHEQETDYNTAVKRMLEIANGTSTEKIKDLYISDDIKILLYGLSGEGYNKVKENEVLTQLLKSSFKTLGFSEGQLLSQADLQAVYFHFIKYELTNFIIAELKPQSINFSCKDAIDRGGVASAYYNLMKSIEIGNPMSQEEFTRALHAAPTLVKGRGMNHHTQHVWNVIDAYVREKQQQSITINPPWLVEWRNENAPAYTNRYYIQKLEVYVKDHKKTKNTLNQQAFFGSSTSTKERSQHEVDAATKLLNTLLNTIKNRPLSPDKFSFEEKQALLNDRTLSKIVASMEKHHLLPSSLSVSEYQHDWIRARH